MRLRVVTLSSPARYGLAIALIGFAAALRVALNPVWGVGLPYITFYPAVMLAAWLGGLGPGLVATALSALLAELLDPTGSDVRHWQPRRHARPRRIRDDGSGDHCAQ